MVLGTCVMGKKKMCYIARYTQEEASKLIGAHIFSLYINAFFLIYSSIKSNILALSPQEVTGSIYAKALSSLNMPTV